MFMLDNITVIWAKTTNISSKKNYNAKKKKTDDLFAMLVYN